MSKTNKKFLRLSLTLLLVAIVLFGFKMITVYGQGAEEALSAQTSLGEYDYTMVYQYPLMNRDGTVIQLKLVKMNKPVCAEIDGMRGCVMGFTQHASDYKRKMDIEHPVDTTETVNVVFTPGKIPLVDEINLLHELYHANDFHWHSRSVCESNWRYSECMESQAYNYTHLIKQVRDLQKQKKLKLI